MTESAAPKQGRPFSPGVSGNPAGRPKGARNRATVLAEKLMGDDAEAVTRAVIEAAKNGDMTAARLVLDRLVPVRRGRPVAIDLPKIASSADLLQAFTTLSEALAEGEVTPEEALAVTAILDTHRKAIETHALDARLCRLEERSR